VCQLFVVCFGCCQLFFTACRHNHDRIVELVVGLKDRKVPLDETSFYGAPPLTLAMRAGNVRMAKLLLEAGAMTSVADNRGNLPIHAACMAGEAKVEVFLSNFFSFSCIDDFFLLPLFSACGADHQTRIASEQSVCKQRRAVHPSASCLQARKFSYCAIACGVCQSRDFQGCWCIYAFLFESFLNFHKEKKKGEDSESAIPKPKRGRSSFILFVQANRSEALERHPDLESNKMLMTILQVERQDFFCWECVLLPENQGYVERSSRRRAASLRRAC
jgi:hypothetical protein